MKKLHINFMKDLQNHEFAELYRNLCTSINVERLEDIHAINSFKAIKKHESDIVYIRNDSRSHELTGVINEQVGSRTNYLRAFRMHIDAFQMSPCDKEKVAARVLWHWLRQQGKDLYAPSINIQSRLVKNLMHVRKMKVEIKEAISFLRLDHHFDAIVAINKEIDANFMQRNKEMALNTKKSREIRNAAYRDLKIFAATINLFLEIYAESEEETIYHEYGRLINELLTHYHTKLKSRTTKRKNKKEVEAAVKELVGSQHNPQKALPMEASQKVKADSSSNRATSDASKETGTKTSTETKSTTKSKDTNTNTKEEPNQPPTSDKGRAKNGDGKIPPISKN